MLDPLVRALSQLDDPVFFGVLARSIAWSLVCFVALGFAAAWGIEMLLRIEGPWHWLIDLLSAVGAALLAFWLFLPAAAVIGSFYFDRVADAVERRFYPAHPAGAAAPLAAQAWDGVALGLRVLGLNVVALVLALVLPGIGHLLGWAIAAYAIGRGLFVAVAMRRMPRSAAEVLYRRHRATILAQGGILAAAAYIPLANLLIPVIGVAAMVHVLDRSQP